MLKFHNHANATCYVFKQKRWRVINFLRSALFIQYLLTYKMLKSAYTVSTIQRSKDSSKQEKWYFVSDKSVILQENGCFIEFNKISKYLFISGGVSAEIPCRNDTCPCDDSNHGYRRCQKRCCGIRERCEGNTMLLYSKAFQAL